VAIQTGRLYLSINNFWKQLRRWALWWENGSHHYKATQLSGARGWVRVIAALHHAIGKVEKPSLEGIRHHDPDTSPITYQSSSHLFPSSLFCFLVLANQLSRCGYSLPTLLETKPPFP
jgi:hypothetical protein